MQDLNDLYFFAQVVENGGFAAAARKLGIPRSRLSRRVGVLEERLGVRLVQRTTRHFAVTEIGREYHQHCLAMMIQADAAQESIDLSRTTPRGTLRIACPPGLLAFHVGAMVTDFMTACPNIKIEMKSINRRVDVIAEGYDIVFRVRFSPLEDSGLVMRELARSPQRLLAAPALLEDRVPRSPADLSSLPSLSWTTGIDQHAWQLTGPDGEEAEVIHRPRLATEDMLTLRQAALAGLGIVQLPLVAVESDIETGALVEVLPGWVAREGLIHLIFPTRRGMLPATRAFIDHMFESFAPQRNDAA